MLHFGAVYYESEVYIDGEFVGRHHGGSSSFSYDITPFVKIGKIHNLVVVASSDVRSGLQTAGKQSLQLASHNCNYTRTTGIWQTVWMEAVDSYALKALHVIPDIDQQQVIIHPTYYRQSTYSLTVRVRDSGKVIATKTVTANNSTVIAIPVKDPKLWSPESPFLYDLELSVTTPAGEEVDRVSSYFGMRKIHV
ncbi:sugar-binding domain-containing protein, partial [Sphingobacterium sp. SGG-5]|uniref:sugar-binding domain-containing protein n=1 Tax=Sphingobacterium sp. SGG-5 TaxID=2710881 RepID=UPI00397836DE